MQLEGKMQATFENKEDNIRSIGEQAYVDDHIKKLEKVQNNALRRIIDAPWYVRNTLLRRDLKINSIKKKLPRGQKKTITRL